MQPHGELNRFALAITPARRRLWVLLFSGPAGQLLNADLPLESQSAGDRRPYADHRDFRGARVALSV
jgi:hypothetical protein